MNIELTAEELAILEAMLHKELCGLPVEIHHTRTQAVKDLLKDKQVRVERLLEKVRSVSGSPS